MTTSLLENDIPTLDFHPEKCCKGEFLFESDHQGYLERTKVTASITAQEHVHPTGE